MNCRRIIYKPTPDMQKEGLISSQMYIYILPTD